MKTEPFGPLEQKVMDILWKSSKSLKPIEVLQELKGDYAYTTIMTILKRLTDKKIVCRKMSGKVYFYSPCLSREVFITKNLSGIFNGLVDSYGQVAIANFVDVIKNDKKDLGLLKKYLASQK